MGESEGQECAYCNFSSALNGRSDYKQAKEYHKQILGIGKDLGDRAGQGRAYGNLGCAYQGLGDFQQAIEYHKQDLSIAEEVEDRAGQGRAYGNLGCAYQGLGDFKQAIEYHKQDLSIAEEVGDKAGQGRAYGNLGTAYKGLGDFTQAIECHNFHLTIVEKGGDKAGQGRAYGNLGCAYQGLGDFQQAIEYHKQDLSIAEEVEDRTGQGRAYGNLGCAYQGLGDFKQAIECHKHHLSIAEEVGDRAGQGRAYGNLGNAYDGLGDFRQAIEYHKQHLSIAEGVGDRAGQGRAYGNLGSLYAALRQFRQATECFRQNNSIAKEIGDKALEAQSYDLLGSIRKGLGDLKGGIENFLHSLKIAEEIGGEVLKGVAYCGLAGCYERMRDFKSAIEYNKQHLIVAKQVGDRRAEGCACHRLGNICELTGCLDEAVDFYRQSVKAYNALRCLLQGEDAWKINFRNMHQDAYTALLRTLVILKKTHDALCAVEQGRAQALVDLMQLQYSYESLSSATVGVEEMISNVSTQMMFVALEGNKINLWVVSKGNKVEFRQIETQSDNASCFLESLRRNTLKEFGIAGRSLHGVSGEENNSLRVLYENVIGPIANVLQGDELIIAPEGPLCLSPFAAFVDNKSRYFSESIRIRIVPSLTTLKLIENCSEGYHAKSGALVVGDPLVEEVIYWTGERKFTQLPCAKKEAEMIGKILLSAPLTGMEATKEEVLKRISSVALVHIAAHGDRETGEIALAPNPTRQYKIPEKKDYMLQIADVQAVQIRARLVVLSYPHSGQGEVNAEGVVGIARAFLGAGARSVLVSLWAIDDEATLEFMTSFYQHMRDGDSASVSLNRAMKFLRKSEKFSAVKYWAPFVLIGDDVTLEFGER